LSSRIFIEISAYTIGLSLLWIIALLSQNFRVDEKMCPQFWVLGRQPAWRENAGLSGYSKFSHQQPDGMHRRPIYDAILE
jgi:hypothetical protein